MCYPKPGPRCSAHARKALVKAHAAQIHAQGHEYVEAKEAFAAAENDFHMTPDGQKDLQRRIDRGEDRDGQLKIRKEYFATKRREALRAIKVKNATDRHSYKEGELTPITPYTTSSFAGDEDIRHPWSDDDKRTRINDYVEDSGRYIEGLTSGERSALRWFTSDGSGKSYKNYVEGEQLSPEDQRQQRLLDSALKKYKPSGTHVVYRGMQHLPEELHDNAGAQAEEQMANDPAYKDISYRDRYDERAKLVGPIHRRNVVDHLTEKFPPGSTITIPHHQSATVDPGVAGRFTGIDEVVMEIKTSKAIPVGAVSAWNASEREMVVPRGQKFRVVGIKQNVQYADIRRGDPTTGVTVVQLEEVV